MPAAAHKPHHTFAEYLAREASAPIRHEYVNGEIFAMAGGSIEHGRLCMSLGSELRLALAGRPCVVLSSDVRLRVRETGLATYPDLSVVCGRIETDPENAQTITNPVLLVEVLSDSTETYDRTVKHAHYRRIPSLRDYLLVDQHTRHIEHIQRNDDGSWTLRDVEAGGVITLSALDCRLSVDAIYANPLHEGGAA